MTGPELEKTLEAVVRKVVAPLKDELVSVSAELKELRRVVTMAMATRPAAAPATTASISGAEDKSAIPSGGASGSAHRAPPAHSAILQEARKQGLRPGGEKAYHETPLLSIGKVVRVFSGGKCRKATIECVDDDDRTADVVYSCLQNGEDGEANGKSIDEEETVPFSCIKPLENFEVCPASIWQNDFAENLYSTATKGKEGGNELFKMKDYQSAIEQYTMVIDELRRFQPAPGGAETQQWVLVNHEGSLSLGGVRASDSLSERCEVGLYKADVNQVKVLAGVPWRTLIPVHEDYLLLQSSLYMNRARCWMQFNRNKEAAQDLSMVIGLWEAKDEGARRCQGRFARELTGAEVAEKREQLTKAYYLRAKTRAARSKYDLANADIQASLAQNPSAETKRLLDLLEREITLSHKEQVQSNKRIAKEISKWANSAMENMDQDTIERVFGQQTH
eukprot:gnl/MRDRNA2_/MRDRNA2_134759_c0_seq1.p1 gnl/MRDRNA2_/MRDRNA2_134759_c0~~gnl/MRDRNA2_/MRDRNA2_134759_c0_seq1.p1  ORF type:complete len:449 (-),score=97.85 gnl/MRDRNA2_/MRDRNA2_134759_c0_seq1:46-1392(-)